MESSDLKVMFEGGAKSLLPVKKLFKFELQHKCIFGDRRHQKGPNILPLSPDTIDRRLIDADCAKYLTLFQNPAANYIKKEFTFPSAADSPFLRIPSSYMVYSNFKVKFNNCESSIFSCVYFCYFTV